MSKLSPSSLKSNITEKANVKIINSFKTLDEIKVEVPEFIEKYKNLFEMITQEGGYDKQNLKTMLVLLEKMDKGLSQHQASVIVGKKLSDKYIHVDDVQQ